MDPSGFSQVGRYGTLSLMKRQETDVIVTAFGIDTEELTFGRDPSCSIRLYYPDIDLLHGKITFEERKAFLTVLGSAGLSIDGCRVYPNGTAGGQPKTIPLLNNSDIEIHNKRFRFSYPPKEMRPTLLATPARNHRRLRLSMIHSAQVFSPRPSKDPKENLRILKSPMKNTFRSPMKPSALSSSPITSLVHDENSNVEEEAEIIVLVEGNRPRVVEEDNDLVILEDIEVPAAQSTTQANLPKTPQRRRSQSLHRAVLLRSVQRTVIEHERQRKQEEEEREEEMEVLDTITGDDINSDEGLFVEPPAGYSASSEGIESDEDEEEVEETQRKSLWRKSFERLWPFKDAGPTEVEDGSEEYDKQEELPEEAQEEQTTEVYGQPELQPTLAQATPIRRPLGTFMTPQIPSNPFSRTQNHEKLRGHLGGGPPVRHSMGGEPRKVPLEAAWRVKDLVVPLKGEPLSEVEPRMPGTPRRSYLLGQAQASHVRPHSEVTAEERKAIQDRRRSALREVDSHSYFLGGIPGMSPTKPAASPVKPGFSESINPFRSVSPIKGVSLPHMVKDIDRRLSTDEEDEKLDTRSLLERMKETVEGMKRRRSTLGGPASSPSKPTPNAGTFNDKVQPLFDKGDSETDEDTMDVDPEPISLSRSSSKKSTEKSIEEKPREPAGEENLVAPTIVEESIPDERPEQQEVAEFISETPQIEAPTGHSRSKSHSPNPPSVVHRTASRTTRKAAAQLEEIAEAPEADMPKRNTRKATRATDREEAPVATATARSKRVPTAEPEDIQPTTRRGRKTPTVEENPLPAVQRTSRRAAVKEEKDEGAGPQVLPVRRGRAAKVTLPDGAQKEVHGTTKITTTRTSRAKTPIENVRANDDDPLDAFNESEEAQTILTPPPRVPNKGTAKARKTRTTVKQEAPTHEISKVPTRSRTATGLMAVETPAPTRGRPRKTPSTAPAAAQVEVDKENEPRSGTRSVPASKNSTVDGEDGVIVRVRTGRKAKSVTIKQESDETTKTAQPTVRATRTTRVRTRTT